MDENHYKFGINIYFAMAYPGFSLGSLWYTETRSLSLILLPRLGMGALQSLEKETESIALISFKPDRENQASS